MARYIQNFTNTSLTQATSITSTLSAGNVILFSNDEAQTSWGEDDFFTFSSFSQVKEKFLASTRTYAMLENLLTNPLGNITNSNGKVFVFKTTSTNATQSSFATGTLTSNEAGLKAITDGSFKVAIKQGGSNIYSKEFTGFDFTKLATLQEIADYINSVIPFKLTLESNKFVIESPVFGNGYTIVFEDGAEGTNLIADGLIKITDGTANAGTDSVITDLKSRLKLTNAMLQNDNASVPLLLTLDLTSTHIEEIATYLQNDYDEAQEQKNVFLYALSSINPLLETLADSRNTNSNFKTFLLETPTKDKESLHNYTSLLIANQRSKDVFKANNSKKVLQGSSLSTTNKIALMGRKLQAELYNANAGLTDKGITAFYNNGSAKMLAFGKFLDGDNLITLEKALFKYDFENAIDNFNALQIFNNKDTNPSLTIQDAIVIAEKYKVSIINNLRSNGVIFPFTGATLPFTITDGKPLTVRENEENDMRNIGAFVLPQTISAEDITALRLRFGFLLHTPSGLLKIESTGISFEGQ